MDIENYPNYLIYPDGRVFSKYFNRFLTATIMNTGYYKIDLYKDGERKLFLIHRLIAIHYIPNNNPNFKIINHKNGDRIDNRIENLEWCDQLHNTQSKNTTRNVGYVYFKTDHSRTKPYEARIIINRVTHSKYFKTEQEGRAWLVEISNNNN